MPDEDIAGAGVLAWSRRAGWRRWAFHFGCLVGGIVAVVAGTWLTNFPLKAFVSAAKHGDLPISAGWARAIGVAFAAAICALIFSGFVRLTEGAWPKALRLRQAVTEMLAGIAIGMVLSALSVALLWGFGLYRIVSIADSAAWGAIILAALPIAIGSGVIEEILARGIVMRQLALLTTPGIALAISSLLFGLAHLFNPNASIVVALGLAVEAGLLLGAAYLVTRRLWLVIGLHGAWNFMQAAIVGGALSGEKVTSIMSSTPSGPLWLSGGGFGIEGSVITLVVCTLAGLGLLALARRRGLDLGDRRFDA